MQTPNYNIGPLTPEEIKTAVDFRERSKREFEKLYGIDKETRTAPQWRALVRRYGIAIVMKQDGMTKPEVKAKCK